MLTHLLALGVAIAPGHPSPAACDSSVVPAGVMRMLERATAATTTGVLPSIAYAVIAGGRIVCQGAAGFADRQRGVRATPMTVYAAGSVAKAVTATGIFVLSDKHGLRLDAPIANYTGSVTVSGNAPGPTIRELLAMRGGIGHGWYYAIDSTISDDALLSRYAGPAFPVDRVTEYSNFSYALAATAISSITNRAFDEFMKADVLLALGMRASGFGRYPDAMARGYVNGREVGPHRFLPTAGGGFFTSALDLAEFGRAHMDELSGLIGSRTLRAELRRVRVIAGEVPYGNGFAVLGLGADTLLISNGRVLAGSATLLLVPSRKLGIALLTNTASDALDEFAVQFVDAFIPGIADRFARLRAEVERPRSQSSLRGRFFGNIHGPSGDIPLSVEIVGSTATARLGDADTATHVVDIRHENNLWRGHLPLIIRLPEGRSAEKGIDLELFAANGDEIDGMARIVGGTEETAYGLPLRLTLTRLKQEE